ncbi:hypothetical protein RRG08_053944 [Elysia crispata]|uniref:Uncharacterized protein n=1 Tax=Elysia crispata TaxID=231223 RepID=A0AAE0ZEP5_9GAST|nr:hypothetical protein RRG08_053944 [Elysia crispata]
MSPSVTPGLKPSLDRGCVTLNLGDLEILQKSWISLTKRWSSPEEVGEIQVDSDTNWSRSEKAVANGPNRAQTYVSPIQSKKLRYSTVSYIQTIYNSIVPF